MVGKSTDDDLPREVWRLMSELVLNHQRRRDVSEAVGLSFDRARGLRRVARHPMTMGELADMLGIDRPNATTVDDDLEKRGLVRRVPHPTDRRAKIVEATRKGHALAQRAESILGTPPTTLAGLSKRDLETLRRILSTAAQSGG